MMLIMDLNWIYVNNDGFSILVNKEYMSSGVTFFFFLNHYAPVSQDN